MKKPRGLQLIIGLGNPGPEFENTYHNAGMMAVQYLANPLIKDGKPAWKTHKKLFSYARVEPSVPLVPCPVSPVFILILPLTFMNESGLAAKEAIKKFNAAPEDLTVIHDDSDLPLGESKTSRNQGAAGHKGVQSVIDHIGTKDFKRIRIGVRTDERQGIRKKAGDFVLNRITPRDKKALEKVFEEIETCFRFKASNA
jgi:peptidyl-tRNA hydrolase, PTH1 family